MYAGPFFPRMMQGRGNPTPGFSLTALTLAWSTAASDNTPGFEVSGASLDVAPVDAQIELQVSSDVGFTPPPSDTELSAVTGNPVIIAVSPALSDGQYWARARLLDSGASPLTDWSNVVTETIATVSAEVTQYLARATGMDATHINAFTALIDGLVADDVWDDLDVLYVLATDTEAHAKLNLKGTSFALTENGTVPWTADIGYAMGGGVTNTLDSGYTPSTAGGVLTLNSAHIGVWVNTDVDSTTPAIGGSDGTNTVWLWPTNGAGDQTFKFRINNANASGGSVANTDASGHYIANRSASGAMQGYRNGASVGTAITASSALPAATVAVGGSRFIGTITASAHIISAAHIGASLDATKADALYDRLAAYRTAVGL